MPVQALIWEAWRLTRARFAFAAGIAIVGCAAILAAAGDRANVAAFLVPFLVTTIALLALIDSPIAGGRFGFPFRNSFARPVSTTMLTLAPMIYVGVLGAALYLVPVIVVGLLFEVAFPLVAASAWIGVVGLAMAAASWSAKGTATSFVGKIVVLFGSLELLRRLNPSSEFPQDPSAGSWPDVLYLSAAEIVVLVLLAAAAIGWAIRGVERQRHMADSAAPLPSAASRVRAVAKISIVEWLRGAPGRFDRLRCPTASPTAAELWLETRRRGIPVIGVSIGIAAAIPLLLALGFDSERGFSILLVIGSFAAPLFAGAGVVGERPGHAAPGTLTAFEASHPISTAALAAVRTAVPTLSILAGWLVIGSSLWVSLPPLRRLVSEALPSVSAIGLAAWAVAALFLFAAVIALFSALNAYFVLYRRGIVGAFLFGFLYVVVLLGAAALQAIGFEVLVGHLWGVAAAGCASAAYIFSRAIAARVLRPAHARAAALAWVVLAAGWAALLTDAGLLSGPTSMAAPLAACLALLPLLSFALAPWSLHRLRHR